MGAHFPVREKSWIFSQTTGNIRKFGSGKLEKILEKSGKLSCQEKVKTIEIWHLSLKKIKLTVLIESVFKKQKCFLCFFSVVFFFPGKVFLSAFFPSECVFFFYNNGKIIVYTAIYHNFLIVPNFFASLCSAY